MFATQICEPIAQKWPLEKSSLSLSKLPRPRMSDPYGLGSPSKPLWPEEGMYLPRAESSNLQQLFPITQDPASDRGHSDAATDSHGASSHGHSFSDFQGYNHGYDQGSSRFRTRTSPSAPSIMAEGTNYRSAVSSDNFWKNRLESKGGMRGIGQHSISSAASSSAQTGHGQIGHIEAEEYSDDGDLVEGDSEGIPQTAAERLASKRKMKRFRLTHQQTRFLMSEFAKQPHPDAAHRDRLSREIPGLSPRQVQVWFQNRRAKIKRLNADDRERVVQMRAVPENFDNVQALHSPYGAVHGYEGPLSHAPSHGQPPIYGSQHPRPLLVDVRRTESENPMQSTGLTPIFGGIGFGQSHVPGMLDTNPMLSSPSTFGSNDRYSYGPRGGGVADNKGSSASSPINEKPGPRPLRPAGLSDPLARGRSASLQSTMGHSLYWRGSGLGDVAEVHDPTPEHGSGGQPPPLHSSGSGMGLNTLFYGGDTAAAQESSTTSDMAPIHQDQFRRGRAASASFPLDSRGQYNEMNQQPMPSPIRNDTARPTASSHAGPTYNTPGYTSSPSFPGSMNITNARLLEPRDQVPPFGYNSGETSSTAVDSFPMTSQPASEDTDHRPFFPATVPVPFGRHAPLPYNTETTEGADTAKRE